MKITIAPGIYVQPEADGGMTISTQYPATVRGSLGDRGVSVVPQEWGIPVRLTAAQVDTLALACFASRAEPVEKVVA